MVHLIVGAVLAVEDLFDIAVEVVAVDPVLHLAGETGQAIVQIKGVALCNTIAVIKTGDRAKWQVVQIIDQDLVWCGVMFLGSQAIESALAAITVMHDPTGGINELAQLAHGIEAVFG